jgi:hypothetical protein
MRCRFTDYRRRLFMLPLLSLHTIAAARGDGLHPILLAGLKRLAAERTEHVGTEATRALEGSAQPTKDRAASEEIAKSERAG